MDLSTVIGLTVCLILVVGGVVAGGEGGAFVDFDSILIVFGGTAGALMMSNPPDRLKSFFKIIKMAFTGGSPDLVSQVQTIVSFAEKARREGLLALEADAAELENEFLKKSIQLVVDGTDPELVKAILDTEIGILEGRHSGNKALFDSVAELGPAFGMLGTVIGLITMLGNLADPDSLGPGMAVALVTTFYGSMLANAFAIPIGKKLAVRSEEEVLSMELMVEGVLSIQAGENPRIVEEKLKVFLPPRQRLALDEKEAEEKGEG
ncbi:MAG: motility protein A [Aminivibrio sp.]